MTFNTPVDENGPRADVLSEAMQLYTLTAELFADGLNELRTAKQTEDREKAARNLAGLTRDYRQSLQSVLNERATIDRLRREHAHARGVGQGSGCLDLDAARDEIGRRLACLRDAGGGG
jgi:hypothetical protein